MSFSRVLSSLQRRGLIAQISSPLVGSHVDNLLATQAASCSRVEPLSAYAGFDPTGPSLHLGHLAVLLALRHVQSAGLRPILLVGGATALIGDPTGKRSDRPLLSRETVAKNSDGIMRSVETLLGSLRVSGVLDPLLVDNADFYRGMDVIAFMRDVGRQFRLSAMLAKESVQTRLHGLADGLATDTPVAGMCFAEFSYQLFQAHDFSVLHRERACAMQIGGSDQWGNITAGLELIRRSHAERPAVLVGGDAPLPAAAAFGMTVPLLTNSSGDKFGKSSSSGGAPVWLDERLTSHHSLYQHLLRTPDADAGRLLRLLTALPEDALAEIETRHAADPAGKASQRALADGVTQLVRGAGGVQAASRCAGILYGGGTEAASASPAPGGSIAAADLIALAASGDIPVMRIRGDDAAALSGLTVIDALVATGLAPSKAEARRLLAAGGVRINRQRVPPLPNLMPQHDQGRGQRVPTPPLGAAAALPNLLAACLIDGRALLLSVGARRQAIVLITLAGGEAKGGEIAAVIGGDVACPPTPASPQSLQPAAPHRPASPSAASSSPLATIAPGCASPQ